MRLARFRFDGADHIGAVEGSELVEVRGGWNELLTLATEEASRLTSRKAVRRWPLDQVELLVPLDETSRGVFCIGFNYWEHNDELGDELGDTRTGRPPIFFKLPSTMLAAGRSMVLDPAFSTDIDWEVELGVVIGRGGRDIAAEDVGSHVAGYTIVVDTTARDLQREHVQWFIGKNAHALSPMGPWITTVDEIGFPPLLELALHVNGIEKQRAKTDDMIWSIEEFISMTSRGVQLRVGDVFATGSPPGVGFTRQPPEFLSRGDALRAEIEKIGWVEHAVE